MARALLEQAGAEVSCTREEILGEREAQFQDAGRAS